MRHPPALLYALLCCLALPGATAPTGGGFTSAGLDGAYYSNTDFSGEPAFVRHDVRIDHDWAEGDAFAGLPVGGSSYLAMRDFPVDDFAIRWTGQLKGRFSETYTFHLIGQDGLRFRIRPAGGSWTTLADSLQAGTAVTADYDLVADARYDIEFSYVDRAGTGASRARLAWSSPSTPEEVIDPLSIAQVNDNHAKAFMWGAKYADLVLGGSEKWDTEVADPDDASKTTTIDAPMDADGWPTVAQADIKLASSGFFNGRYRIRFQGTAQVVLRLTGVQSAIFEVDGEQWDGRKTSPRYSVEKGVGYDAATNTTVIDLLIGDEPRTGGSFGFGFVDGERRPGGEPGITGLQVMSPIAEGADESHAYGELRQRLGREYFANYLLERHQRPGLGHRGVHEWSDRRPATHRLLADTEFRLMLANEQGHDIHFNFPAGWSFDAMLAFAKTVRWGSDGADPYDGPVADPVFPPLNPNLKIYLEHANELPWAIYPYWIWGELHDKAVADHPDWQIVNYDGQGINEGKTLGDSTDDGALSLTGMYRYHALRMWQMAEAFRQVYADQPQAVGDRARVLCFGQYQNPQVQNMLQFLDDYFNNGTGEHVAEPHPPSWNLWGAGGAIYYGTSNKFGIQETEPVTDLGFDQPAVDPGATSLRPSDSPWSWKGTAGVADVVLPRVDTTISSLGAPMPRPEQTVWAGCKFTVGDKDITVYQLGRMRIEADGQLNKGGHGLQIFDSDGKALTTADSGERHDCSVDLDGGRDAVAGEMVWSWTEVVTARGYGYVRTVVPIRLQAGATYYLVSRESHLGGADRFLDADTRIEAPVGITIDAAVIGRDGATWQETTGNRCYGPVGMRFTTRQLRSDGQALGIAPDLSTGAQTEKSFDLHFPTGDQVAFLAPEASMSQAVDVAEDGHYWLTWAMARDQEGGRAADPKLRVLIDDEVIVEQDPVYRWSMWYHATPVVRLTAGRHTITLENLPSRDRDDQIEPCTLFVDEVHLSRDQAFFGGPDAGNFPSRGNAFGQSSNNKYPTTAQAECDMARNWGLIPLTYEGGWAVQGDFDHYGMTAWNDIRFGSELIDPTLTAQGQRNAVEVWCRKGGYIFAYFYPMQRHIWDPAPPLVEGLKAMNDDWMQNPDTGSRVPAVLDCNDYHYSYQRRSDSSSSPNYRGPSRGEINQRSDLVAGEWKNWLVQADRAGDYRLQLTGTGGPLRLILDGAVIATGSLDGTFRHQAFLTAGLHGIKVRADGPVRVDQLIIDQATRAWPQVSGQGQVIVNGDNSPERTDGTDFGSVVEGGLVEHDFLVENLGDEALTARVLLSDDDRADFQIVKQLPETIAGGDAATCSLRYAPLRTGSTTATIVIAHDGIAGRFTFAVTGTATANGSGNRLLATPATLDLLEGDTGNCGLSLAAAPSAPVNVQVGILRQRDATVSLSSATTLTFTPENFDQAQTIDLATAIDTDRRDGVAVILCDADSEELIDTKISVAVRDRARQALVDLVASPVWLDRSASGERSFTTSMVDADGDGNADDRRAELPFDLTTPLTPELAVPSLRVYGGAQVLKRDDDDKDQSTVQVRNGPGEGNDVLRIRGENARDPGEAQAVFALLWQKNDFLHGGARDDLAVVLDDDAGLSAKLATGGQAPLTVRWLIRQGGRLYVSEEQATVAGWGEQTITASALTTTRWARLRPETGLERDWGSFYRRSLVGIDGVGLYASAAAGPQLDGAFDEHPAASTLDLAAFQAYGRLVDPQNLGRRIDAIRVDGHLWQCLEPVEHIEEDKDPDSQTFILDPKQRARLGLVPAGGG